MTEAHSVRCVNCGTSWETRAAEPSPAVASVDRARVCPVCKLAPRHQATVPEQRLSREELERQLSRLITRARASGLDTTTILLALSEELGFAAELGQVGHQFHVQVIDLGLSEGATALRPTRNQRKGFQSGRRELS